MTKIRYYLLFDQYCSLQTNNDDADLHFGNIYQNMEINQQSCQPNWSFQLYDQNRLYYIFINNCLVGEFTDILLAIWQLDCIIVRQLVRNGSNMIALHAGWLVKDDKLVILAGAGNSGKSTLCYLLTRQGWLLGSDEITAIDVETAELIPFPRKILIKPDNQLVLRYKIKPESQNLLYLFDGRFYEQCQGTKKTNMLTCNKVHFIALDYQPLSETAFSQLDTLSALQSILGSCVNIKNISSYLFERLVSLLGPSTASHVIYSSAENLANILIEEKLQ